MNGKLIPVFVLAALMSGSQPPVKEQGPRPVKLAEVTSLNLVEKSFSGVVSPDQFSDLAFKMSGPLISLKVDEGQKVRTGQVVAEIDPQDFKWEYEAKKPLFKLPKHSCNVRRSCYPNRLFRSRNMKRPKLPIRMQRLHSNMRRISWNKRNCVLRSMDLSRRNMSRIIRRYRPGKGSFA